MDICATLDDQTGMGHENLAFPQPNECRAHYFDLWMKIVVNKCTKNVYFLYSFRSL